jgi:hypothetical protein
VPGTLWAGSTGGTRGPQGAPGPQGPQGPQGASGGGGGGLVLLTSQILTAPANSDGSALLASAISGPSSSSFSGETAGNPTIPVTTYDSGVFLQGVYWYSSGGTFSISVAFLTVWSPTTGEYMQVGIVGGPVTTSPWPYSQANVGTIVGSDLSIVNSGGNLTVSSAAGGQYSCLLAMTEWST